MKGLHRSCASINVVYPAEFTTLEGEGKVKGLVYEQDKDRLTCHNDRNKEKPPPPFRWEDTEATCRDFRIRSGSFKRDCE